MIVSERSFLRRLDGGIGRRKGFIRKFEQVGGDTYHEWSQIRGNFGP